jgi:hypothetical protein
MPTRSRIYNISSFNYKSIVDKTKLSSGVWAFPNLSFVGEDIISVKISVLHAEITNAIYIVNENNNDLYIQDSVNGLLTTTFNVGNYTMTSFIDMFNLLTPVGYSMTYDKTTLKCTVLGPRPFSILENSPCKYILGIGDTNLASAGNSVTFPHAVNLLPTARFNLRSQAFKIGNTAADGSNDLLLTIQNTGAILGRSLYQNYGDLKFHLDIDNLQAFDFRITDDFGFLLNFNGSLWDVTFQIDIEYVEKPKPPTFAQLISGFNQPQPK